MKISAFWADIPELEIQQLKDLAWFLHLFFFLGSCRRVKITVPWAIPELEIQQLKDVAQKQLELQEEAARRRAAARRGARARSSTTSEAPPKPSKAGAGVALAQAAQSVAGASGGAGPRRVLLSEDEGISTVEGQGGGEKKAKATRKRKVELRAGVPVKIVKGPYMNLKGTVLSVDKESKQVLYRKPVPWKCTPRYCLASAL